jgi:hypothetical protein
MSEPSCLGWPGMAWGGPCLHPSPACAEWQGCEGWAQGTHSTGHPLSMPLSPAGINSPTTTQSRLQIIYKEDATNEMSTPPSAQRHAKSTQSTPDRPGQEQSP